MRLYFLIYATVGFLRLISYVLTGYLVLLAEFFHGIIDLLILSVLKKAEKISLKPPDEQHPFGHGLAENIGALTVSIAFITIVSFELIREGLIKIMNPGEFKYPFIAIIVLLTTLFLLIIPLYLSTEKRGHLFSAIRTELVNDTLSTSGAIAGVILSAFFPLSDGIFTVMIGLIIAANGLRLYRENAEILLGFSPDRDFYSKLNTIVSDFNEVKDVHDIIAVFTGRNKIHLDMHITVDGEMKVNEADDLTVKISSKIKEKMPEVDYISIHVCSRSSGRFRRINEVNERS